ncbi:MAG: RNA-binding S4 domain-containing protein [Desulfatitalea sp.]|nr:RNA-binding S4 domain-containing protein [Desulfatitalea sp.]
MPSARGVDPMKNIEISQAPVELYKILKFENLVGSGGEAKHVIAQGLVTVNGAVETRKSKKISAGDVIGFGEENFRVQVK